MRSKIETLTLYLASLAIMLSLSAIFESCATTPNISLAGCGERGIALKVRACVGPPVHPVVTVMGGINVSGGVTFGPCTLDGGRGTEIMIDACAQEVLR